MKTFLLMAILLWGKPRQDYEITYRITYEWPNTDFSVVYDWNPSVCCPR